MRYEEAVGDLIKGLYVTRPSWKEEAGYLVRIPGITNFLKVTMQPKPNIVPWAADVENSLADDWEQVIVA